MKIQVAVHERVFVLIDGVPSRYLVPGQHSVYAWFKNIEIERVDTRSLRADLDASRLALVPAEDLQVISLEEHQRAVVRRKGVPVLWLGVGVHQIWSVDRLINRQTKTLASLVKIDIVDTAGVVAPLLTADVAALCKGKDYVEATAPEGSVVIRFVDGQLDAVLTAGRHAGWNTMRTVQLSVIDIRERLLHVTGQEVMTRDRVSLRLNLSATFRVNDAKRLAMVARAPDDVLYLAMQLAVRDAVTTRTLDELLASREELPKVMAPLVGERAQSLGLQLVELGIKDLILPGEMKELLNKVIQATKEAEANVILRREETAATRSLAQTAKVLSENPLLVRLKELEAYKELAGKVGQLHLVMGQSAMPTLQLKG